MLTVPSLQSFEAAKSPPISSTDEPLSLTNFGCLKVYASGADTYHRCV